MIMVGIDEVGRGCWAGPLVAGAVLLREPIAGLADSKQLSQARREELAKCITSQAQIGLGWVEPAEIDAQGLTASVRLAMQRALAGITKAYDEVIIDGSYNFLADLPRTRAIIKADASVPAVSAASIVAKVARDAWMRDQAAVRFPAYGFERHVGYGTALHLERLRQYGICALHRRSYKPIQLIEGLAS